MIPEDERVPEQYRSMTFQQGCELVVEWMASFGQTVTAKQVWECDSRGELWPVYDLIRQAIEWKESQPEEE